MFLTELVFVLFDVSCANILKLRLPAVAVKLPIYMLPVADDIKD